MKFRIFQVLVFLPLFSLFADNSDFTWQLPIQLNDTRYQVYDQLGIPNEISKDSERKATIEFFYDFGIGVIFFNDLAVRITLQQLGSDYYTDYSGNVINDLLLLDTRRDVIKKLGSPALMKTDSLPKESVDENGFRNLSHSYYTWTTADYMLEIVISNIPEKLSDIRTLNKGEILTVRVTLKGADLDR